MVTAGALNDSILAGSGDSLFRMLGGADTVWAGGGADTVIAGAGADNIVLHVGGADRVDLGTKDDSLLLYDYLSAPDLAGGEGGAVYDGGKGNDKLELLADQRAGRPASTARTSATTAWSSARSPASRASATTGPPAPRRTTARPPPTTST